MIICLKSVLTGPDLEFINHAMATAQFIDGKNTAGWHAKLVKNNVQLKADQLAHQEITGHVLAALKTNDLFQVAARPKQISPLLLSKYTSGMQYGTHVDDAFMHGMRSDCSFTIFLNPPNTYDGGELVLDLHHGEQEYKLDAGDMILYPSRALHRVMPVINGERQVCVGWVQSLIRHDHQREILFDLANAQRALFAKEGKSPEFDLLSKSLANLLRMWGEI